MIKYLLVNKKIIIFFGFIVLIFLSYLCYSIITINKQTYRIQPSIIFSSPSLFPLQFPSLGLAAIINSSWKDNLPMDKITTIITTGDVIPARSVNFKMTNYKNFQYPFEKTADFLKSSDLTLINLESPLINACPVTNEGMVFCTNQKFIEGLKYAQIDIANFANNHSYNWGVEGFQETINLLKENDILVSGNVLNNLVIKTVKEIKFGFAGFNLLENFNEPEILENIKLMKKEVDVLFISVHWGQEYKSFPSLWQVVLAHKIINSGADALVGNHPHWIQPLEIYHNKLILFLFWHF